MLPHLKLKRELTLLLVHEGSTLKGCKQLEMFAEVRNIELIIRICTAIGREGDREAFCEGSLKTNKQKMAIPPSPKIVKHYGKKKPSKTHCLTVLNSSSSMFLT